MNLKQKFVKMLSSIMPENESISEIEFIIKEHLNIERTKLILNPDLLETYENEILNILNERLKTRRPLQYILNKAVFNNEIYYVDENVLIPRPETEILVYETAKYLNSDSKILEIGTGSGCIAISLAKILNNNNITSCDISPKALDVAKINAKNLCSNLNINFLLSDLYENVYEKFDAIISNPPYIDYALAVDMQPEVLQFEPHNALFAENKGMLIYEKIINNAHLFLKKNGLLALEAGINQAGKIKELMHKAGFAKVIIITDLSSIDRVVLGWYN